MGNLYGVSSGWEPKVGGGGREKRPEARCPDCLRSKPAVADSGSYITVSGDEDRDALSKLSALVSATMLSSSVRQPTPRVFGASPEVGAMFIRQKAQDPKFCRRSTPLLVAVVPENNHRYSQMLF